MRCPKHLTDGSSSVGVCASCLREHLFALIASQAQTQSHYKQFEDDDRKSDSSVTQLVFPRSVSHRTYQNNSFTGIPKHRFYTTPQVDANGTTMTHSSSHKKKKKKKTYGFSFLSGLFRSNSKKPDADSGPDHTVSTSRDSWFSGFVAGLRVNQSRTFSMDDSTIGGNRGSRRHHDRALSPARCSNDVDEHCDGRLSGYSSETPKRTPNTQPCRRRSGRSGHNRSLSGMSFCWSPLVRASPSRQWSHKGTEMAHPGEIRVPAKPRLSNTTSFCKNRSRKLTDIGRFNSNR